ncbi:MAG TPA: FMN-binding protein, partial [Candidatus Sulfotelmatobacter sp.]|nr:FMN-binding protein [Candidatus Sulfotelmatobacter sp.]
SLAYVYMLTQPRINANAGLALEQARKEVLPGGQGQAIPVTVTGYHGPISMMVGIDNGGKVSGVKIISQKETAGLGADIVKPKFLKQFIGKDAKSKLEVKQDIDAITGASISSRAVCQGVKDALEKFQPGNN